ncbi:MAG: YncE family protein [Bacteroidales bacterium]|jgi:DNA-binding beta-propeller fold protein YncE|nr:YncE family protein [Bacteroidales bacterium]
MKKSIFSNKLILTAIYALVLVFNSCRKDDPTLPSTPIVINPWEQVTGDIYGFFLLNEGNMGSNKASLDYYDYETGVYTRNIYGERNPNEVKDLGDVGNDIQIYGNRLYAIINCSNYLEVMDVTTAKHITKIAIPNCRYVVFKDQYAYVSAYAGPVQIDPNARIGYVAKIDTAALKVVGECIVGYQPEEMAVVGDKLYVANSGGYRVPNYDRTVSVIDLIEFKEIKKIDVAINLHRITPDNYGNLYVSSRGDYYNVPSKTFIIDTKTDEVTDTLHLLPNSNMTLCRDSLFVYSTEWSYITKEWTVSYAIVNVKTKKIVTRNFIKDGSDQRIKTPYGIAVNPNTGEFFVTDAKDYVTPGTLHCFGSDGVRKWSVTTGDIPAHMVFTRKKLKPLNEI